MKALGEVLETAVYCRDLEAVRKFYGGILGLEEYSYLPDQFVFYRLGRGMFLVFNPETSIQKNPERKPDQAPHHGATGPGHMAFRIGHDDLTDWRQHLVESGVAIEAEFQWPSGGRSIYFRDPGDNSIELATPDVWP